MVATVAFRPKFVQRRFAVDSVSLTPIYLTDYDAFDVHLKNSDPLVGWWIYTDETDEDSKEYVFPGAVKSFVDTLIDKTPAPFPRHTPKLWVKVDSGVGPMETTWRTVKEYTS